MRKRDRDVRLLHLRRVVEAAPEKKFRMARFSTLMECGTAYCAAGWAGIDPWFKKRGLRLVNTRWGGPEIFYKRRPAENENALSNLETFFGLSRDQACNLFGGKLRGYESVPKQEVLANIDRLLHGQEPIEYQPANSV